MPRVGERAPDFEAVDHLGRPFRLRDLRGRKVVLWFYPQADTPGCTAEGCAFRDLYDQYHEKNTEVVGVSFDSVDENRAFAEKYYFPYRLISDTDRKIGMLYGACESPSDKKAKRIAFVIDENGTIAEAELNVTARQYPFDQLERMGESAKI